MIFEWLIAISVPFLFIFNSCLRFRLGNWILFWFLWFLNWFKVLINYRWLISLFLFWDIFGFLTLPYVFEITLLSTNPVFWHVNSIFIFTFEVLDRSFFFFIIVDFLLYNNWLWVLWCFKSNIRLFVGPMMLELFLNRMLNLFLSLD